MDKVSDAIDGVLGNGWAVFLIVSGAFVAFTLKAYGKTSNLQNSAKAKDRLDLLVVLSGLAAAMVAIFFAWFAVAGVPGTEFPFFLVPLIPLLLVLAAGAWLQSVSSKYPDSPKTSAEACATCHPDLADAAAKDD